MSNIDIKDIWKSQKAGDISDEELDRMRMVKSETFLDRLKKNARMENAGNIVATIGLSLFLAMNHGYVVGAVCFVFMGLVSYYYFTLYREIWRIEPTSDVKAFLQLILDKMNTFLRRYYTGIAIIFPIFFYIGLNIDKEEAFDFAILFEIRVLMTFVVTIAICVGIIYGIVYLIYGKTVKKLKDMLRSLEENEMY